MLYTLNDIKYHVEELRKIKGKISLHDIKRNFPCHKRITKICEMRIYRDRYKMYLPMQDNQPWYLIIDIGYPDGKIESIYFGIDVLSNITQLEILTD